MIRTIGTVVGNLLRPGFYSSQYTKVVTSVNKRFIQGSPLPLFQGMVLVGTIGYTAEYIGIGRHHVLEKQALIQKALENHHH